MLSKVTQALKRFHADDRGAMAVEKILLLAIISLPIVLILFYFRDKIIGWFNTNAEKLNNNAPSGGTTGG